MFFMRALGALLLLVGVVIGYGYLDAYSERTVNPKVTARVISLWGMWFDSMPTDHRMENGQLHLRVDWNQPSETQRVSSIHVKGSVEQDGKDIAAFDAPCVRAHSTWLGDGLWKYGDAIDANLVCFVKLDLVLQPQTSGEVVTMDEAATRIADMTVRFTAKVKAVKKPMRYVTWINEVVGRAWETLTLPFARS